MSKTNSINKYILEIINNIKYVFKIFPSASCIKCDYNFKHDVILLVATPKKLFYISSKRKPILDYDI
jgi:hypothetical protein